MKLRGYLFFATIQLNAGAFAYNLEVESHVAGIV